MLTESLRGKMKFGKEYACSVRQIKNKKKSDKEEGRVGLLDELGTWLCNTRASNHYSPFKHLFLNLMECILPAEILTGNGLIYAYYCGDISQHCKLVSICSQL